MQSDDHTTHQTGDILVVGYGNTLRGDDGVGPRLVEALGAMNLPAVRTIVCQLLTPELGEAISQARFAIFVDATLEAPNEVRFRRLEPNKSSQIMAHAADPGTMLAVARDVFGQAPAAWWLTIPASHLEFSQQLSPQTQIGCAEAMRKLLILCRSLQMS